jgi:RNA polymerase sigma-70 factor (ECF subfamily)
VAARAVRQAIIHAYFDGSFTVPLVQRVPYGEPGLPGKESDHAEVGNSVVTAEIGGTTAVHEVGSDADTGLVEALRRDEPDAAEQLVERYGERVYRLAVRITGVRADAEEAAQDALWTAARKIHTFKGESAFGSWLYRITANAAYQKLRWRRRKAQEIALDDVLPALDGERRHFESVDDWSNRVDERALQGELRQVLTDAIAALPADYQAVLMLHDVEGLSNPDIAETLGISLPAVKSRVHRARLFVRKRLSEYLDDSDRVFAKGAEATS